MPSASFWFVALLLIIQIYWIAIAFIYLINPDYVGPMAGPLGCRVLWSMPREYHCLVTLRGQDRHHDGTTRISRWATLDLLSRWMAAVATRREGASMDWASAQAACLGSIAIVEAGGCADRRTREAQPVSAISRTRSRLNQIWRRNAGVTPACSPETRPSRSYCPEMVLHR